MPGSTPTPGSSTLTCREHDMYAYIVCMCLLRLLFRSDRCHRCPVTGQPVAPGTAAASALGLSSVARKVGQYMECIGVSALTVHTTLALQSSALASLAS